MMSWINNMLQAFREVSTPADFRDLTEQARQADKEYFDGKDILALEKALAVGESITKAPNFVGAPPSFQVAALGRSAILRFYRHCKGKQLEDLDRALQYWEEATHVAPADFPVIGALFASLAVTFTGRFQVNGETGDMQRAIAAFEQAIAHMSGNSPDLPDVLWNFAFALFTKYKKTGETIDLDRAIRVADQTVELTSFNAERTPAYLDSLGTYLRTRHEKTGSNETDLDRAVAVSQKSVDLTPHEESELANRLFNLGAALLDRFSSRGSLPDLDRAIGVYESGLALVSDQSSSLMFLLALMESHWKRYDREGKQDDIEKSIEFLQRFAALRSSPISSGNVAGPRLLAHMLLERYDRTGAIQDVETATRLIQTAVNQTPAGSAALPGHLQALGNARYLCYEHQGDFADLQAAVDLNQRALDLTPSDSPDRATRISNLADALQSLDEREETLKDLEQAVHLLRGALETNPSDPVLFWRLGKALVRRFRRTGEIRDIGEAVSVLEKCVSGTPAASPKLAGFLNSFGNAKLLQYRRTKDASDLERSIAALEQAVDVTPRESPSRPTYLNNLASALGDRYCQTRSASDCERATDNYRVACKLGLALNLKETINTAHFWGNWAAERAIADEITFDEAAEAYGYGLEAVQQLFCRQLFLEGKNVWLRENRLLPGRAAFALAASDRVEEAVVTLERSRALLLSESLRRGRAKLEHLAALGRENLMTQFRQSSERMNGLDKQQRREDRIKSPEFLEELRSARVDFDKTISEIRQVPGYESFLQPPTYAEIQSAADAVPIIYLTASRWGGLALVVWPSRIGRSAHACWQSSTPVWLKKLDEESAFRMLFIGTLSEEISDHGPFGYFLHQAVWQQLHASAKAQHEFSQILDQVTRWLWDAAIEPLLDVLLAAGERRVVLIPEGLLSFFPFHAAWKEKRSSINGRKYALDELTISYAPSALAISEARQIARTTISESFLGIANPFPSSTHDALPHAQDEVEMAASQFQSRLVLPPEEGTFDRVRGELPRYSVLHFACHGEAEIGEPLNNGLFLADDRKLALRDFFGMDLHARLAVLSACDTGVVDMQLPNEVISLPTGLLQAGVAGIVSSQWAVDEIGTMLLVGRFFELWRTHRCEPSEALRSAQLWLRDASNGELLSYAKKLLPSVDASSGEWEYIASYPSERAFSNSRHWAAFTYVGV